MGRIERLDSQTVEFAHDGRLLFVVTEDWYFLSHRLPLARAARARGWDVGVATRVGECEPLLRREGFRVFPLRALRRSSTNPIAEAAAIGELARIYRSFRPGVVHHVAIKPVLYGTMAARLVGVPRVVNALAGLGYLFSSRTIRARLLRRVAVGLLREAMDSRRVVTILQNPDDREVLVRLGITKPERTALIRGSGVDVDRFRPAAGEAASGVPVILYAGRMLRDKGIGELVGASRRLRDASIEVRVVLVGDPDPSNPSSIPEGTLHGWVEEGVVEWLGRRSDVDALLRGAAIACLPSYREGVPKFLLEAAASGVAIVSTDVPGCREIARDGDNALLVPPRDERALFEALSKLLDSQETRRRFGLRGREIVMAEFREQQVVDATLDLYRVGAAR